MPRVRGVWGGVEGGVSRPRATDHRGRTHEFCDPYALPKDVPVALFGDLVRVRQTRRSNLLFRLCIGVPLGIGVLWWATPFRGEALALGVAIWAGIILLEYGLFRTSVGNPARQMTGAILKQGLCPACAYAIRGGTPESDGCVVCPECGAAWRVAQGQVDGNRP
jgi:hypothetical protein